MMLLHAKKTAPRDWLSDPQELFADDLRHREKEKETEKPQTNGKLQVTVHHNSHCKPG